MLQHFFYLVANLYITFINLIEIDSIVLIRKFHIFQKTY